VDERQTESVHANRSNLETSGRKHRRHPVIRAEQASRSPPRSEGGLRLYSSSDLSTLLFIRNLQTLGFSLNEIREFLSLRSDDLRACFEVRKMLDHKLRDIHVKRIALGKLEAELKDALAKRDSQLRRPRGKQHGRCPVLTAYKGSKHEGAA